MTCRSIILTLLTPYLLFSQGQKKNYFTGVSEPKWNEREGSDNGIKGVSLGCCFRGRPNTLAPIMDLELMGYSTTGLIIL